jgi:hypothetical protein
VRPGLPAGGGIDGDDRVALAAIHDHERSGDGRPAAQAAVYRQPPGDRARLTVERHQLSLVGAGHHEPACKDRPAGHGIGCRVSPGFLGVFEQGHGRARSDDGTAAVEVERPALGGRDRGERLCATIRRVDPRESWPPLHQRQGTVGAAPRHEGRTFEQRARRLVVAPPRAEAAGVEPQQPLVRQAHESLGSRRHDLTPRAETEKIRGQRLGRQA